MTPFETIPKELFFSRNDPQDQRLGDRALNFLENRNPEGNLVTLAGYPDDEGIGLNGGKLGAKEAPNKVRHFFYRAAALKNTPAIQDLGNLKLNSSLAERHQHVREKAKEIISRGGTWLSIGGGHDYAFGDGAGFLDASLEGSSRPLIINIDAHLDVRDLSRGLTSGTPFYRLLTEFPNKFDFVEIGIQSQCNSEHHRQWLKEKNGTILDLESLRLSGENLVTFATRHMQDILVQRRPTFLSIDIDAFSSSFAPGCSQSWPIGLTVEEFFPLLHVLKRRLDIRAAGIYEVSPPLDVADITSKLAANLLYQLVH